MQDHLSGNAVMMKPPTPVDELLRLETLRNLKILDTDPEERFEQSNEGPLKKTESFNKYMFF